MVVFAGHGMINEYSCEVELEKPEYLKAVLKRVNMSEELQEQIIFVREHAKLEYDSIISNDDKIDMFMVVMGG